ncbi:siderophore ABC transporter substrate-binding protein [Reinekea marinisedimentorum]|uniref:Iron complex transport system substrate-binding protein n=1 Tax=Reinekea marinisedimentorum TaxID=230495 RepID=A0A4R3HUK9_9GAMM|nr:siderophore ABC transporter substrate-binding protein [Reinekea marinisedimentorum]TCS36404.1 iron complex transport system substrate-binding protein [Reinekea marinisedimentorum]
MIKLKTAGLAVTFAALLPLAQAKTVTHAQGTTEIDAVPEKIIALDLAAVDTLNTLGVEITGLPKPHAYDYLEKFTGDQYTSVGSFWEPDFETIAALQPDLIVIGGRSQKQYKAMSKIAPTVDATVWNEPFLDQFYSVTEMLADSVDKSAQAEAELAAIKARVEQIKTAPQNNKNALFILTSGGKISAFGPGSRFGWIHDELGIEPTVKDVETETHGDPISFEFLQKVNPDMIFVMDRDAAIGQDSQAAKALLDNELVHQLTAYKNDDITFLNGYSWYMVAYGLTAMNNMLDEIETALGIDQ